MDFLAPAAAKLVSWWTSTSLAEKMWLLIGITGQLMFSMRWIFQWLASERARSAVVPASFWYHSLVGGLMVMAYGIYRLDPVIIMGQFGVLVYARNVYFLMRGQRAAAPPNVDVGEEALASQKKR